MAGGGPLSASGARVAQGRPPRPAGGARKAGPPHRAGPGLAGGSSEGEAAQPGTQLGHYRRVRSRWGARMRRLAEAAQAPIAHLITLLAEAAGPVVYRCAAGKDRTGVVSAVLLGLLGVRDEVVVADYAATGENLDAIIERLMAARGYQTMLAALPPDTLHAEAETMIAFLARIRERYGSMRGYVRAAGVADAVVERLAERLLER